MMIKTNIPIQILCIVMLVKHLSRKQIISRIHLNIHLSMKQKHLLLKVMIKQISPQFPLVVDSAAALAPRVTEDMLVFITHIPTPKQYIYAVHCMTVSWHLFAILMITDKCNIYVNASRVDMAVGLGCTVLIDIGTMVAVSAINIGRQASQTTIVAEKVAEK